jgi:hypothetical protein
VERFVGRPLVALGEQVRDESEETLEEQEAEMRAKSELLDKQCERVLRFVRRRERAVRRYQAPTRMERQRRGSKALSFSSFSAVCLSFLLTHPRNDGMAQYFTAYIAQR